MLFLCRRRYILHAILFGNFVWISASIAIDSNLIAGSIKHFLKKEHNIQGLQSLSNLIPDLFSDSKTIHARQDLLFVYHDGVTDKSVALNCSEHCHRLVTVMLIVDSYHRDKKKFSLYARFIFVYFTNKVFHSCVFLGEQHEARTHSARPKTYGIGTCFTLLNSNSPRYATL